VVTSEDLMKSGKGTVSEYLQTLIADHTPSSVTRSATRRS